MPSNAEACQRIPRYAKAYQTYQVEVEDEAEDEVEVEEEKEEEEEGEVEVDGESEVEEEGGMPRNAAGVSIDSLDKRTCFYMLRMLLHSSDSQIFHA